MSWLSALLMNGAQWYKFLSCSKCSVNAARAVIGHVVWLTSDESGFLRRTARKLFFGFTQNFVDRCFYEINMEICTSNFGENEFLTTQKTRQQRR